MKCFNCNNEIKYTDTFCPNCGISIIRLKKCEPFIISFEIEEDTIESKMIVYDWGISDNNEYDLPTNFYLSLRSKPSDCLGLKMQRILGGIKDAPNND